MRVEQNPKPERKPRKERRAAPAGDTAPLQIARVLDLLEAHAVRK